MAWQTKQHFGEWRAHKLHDCRLDQAKCTILALSCKKWSISTWHLNSLPQKCCTALSLSIVKVTFGHRPFFQDSLMPLAPGMILEVSSSWKLPTWAFLFPLKYRIEVFVLVFLKCSFRVWILGSFLQHICTVFRSKEVSKLLSTPRIWLECKYFNFFMIRGCSVSKLSFQFIEKILKIFAIFLCIFKMLFILSNMTIHQSLINISNGTHNFI